MGDHQSEQRWTFTDLATIWIMVCVGITCLGGCLVAAAQVVSP
jgi:hypothetical protein